MIFDETDGLAQAIVSGIQDNQGFLWFGTEGNNGVFRYDGVEFLQYKHNPFNVNSIVPGSIYSIITDRKGFIWFASNGGGLSRFNKETSEFTNFIHDPSNSNSPGDNTIYSLLEDSKGNIWIATAKSLDKYSSDDNSFTHYYASPGTEGKLTESLIYHLFESRDGTIWIGTYGGGLNALDPLSGEFTSYLSDPDDPGSIANNTCGAVIEDHDGFIWVGGKGGLNRLDRNTGLFTHFQHDPDNPRSIADNYIWDIIEDGNGNLWLGGFGGGLAKLNRETGEIQRFLNNPTIPGSLSSNLVFFMMIDRGGVLWVGTVDGGLNKYNLLNEQFAHYMNIPDDANSFAVSSLFTIYQTDDDYIWIGGQGHQSGLTRWDREKEEMIHFLPDDTRPGSLPSGEVLSLYEDSRGDFYIGQFGLSRFDREKSVFSRIFPPPENTGQYSGKTIRKIIEDSNQNLLLASEFGLVRIHPDRKDYEILFENTPMTTAYIDNSGNLWVGTASAGLRLFNQETGQWAEYVHDHEDPASIASGEISIIYQDKKMRIWIGTIGGGLNLWNPDDKSFKHFTEDEGFISNSIFSIEEDSSGSFWIGTSNGLINFNYAEEIIRNFTVFDGLQGNEFSIRNDNSLTDSNGLLYFPGKNGLTVFNPLSIRQNMTPPAVVLTSFKVFNKEYDLERSPSLLKELELSWKDSMITFEFSALDFNNPRGNEYAYMLEGFDKNWIHSENSPIATYTNLDGGDYTFRVKASNSHGVWNNTGLELTIRIIPPWWKTWWAVILYFLVTIILVLSFVRYRLSSLEKAKLGLEIEVEERTKELKDSLTTLKETQDQLIESGKMAALGGLVAGVAHEINTPIGIGITAASHFTDITKTFSNKFTNGEITKREFTTYINDALENSDMILINMKRAAKLIQSFKEVAVDQSSENIRNFKIGNYIQEILVSLNPKFKRTKHKININLAEDFIVHSYPGALSQIMTNLIMNSLIHGFEEIETGLITIDINRENETAIIEYRDTGRGIPACNIPIIFDPFFTTKRGQGGSGLGMHILFNLVTQTLQGKVECVDTSSKGVFFRIIIPCFVIDA